MGKKRKLAPWELERKIARAKTAAEKLAKRNRLKARQERIDWPIDGRKHGRALTVKKARGITLSDIASFRCPKCGERLKINLIRLRQDLHECRTCKHTFIKEGITDDFELDLDI